MVIITGDFGGVWFCDDCDNEDLHGGSRSFTGVH